jgi:hypothetical protein
MYSWVKIDLICVIRLKHRDPLGGTVLRIPPCYFYTHVKAWLVNCPFGKDNNYYY